MTRFVLFHANHIYTESQYFSDLLQDGIPIGASIGDRLTDEIMDLRTGRWLPVELIKHDIPVESEG